VEGYEMTDGTELQTLKIVVTGAYASGKTTFINTISEIDRAVTENATVAMDFGRITVDESLVLYLFGTPGRRRFDFMWEILHEGMLGFVVMVDSTKPETFREGKSIIETFRAYAPVPYIVAANKHDCPEAWDVDSLRIALRLEPDIPVIPCVAHDRESIKDVLLVLLNDVLELVHVEPEPIPELV
jgi:small GTP-binding protein